MDWKETNRSKSCKYQGRLRQSHKGFFGFGITFMEPLSASAASGWRVHIRHLPKATESPGAFLSAHSIPWKSWKAIKTRKYHKTNKTSILWSKTCSQFHPSLLWGFPTHAYEGPPSTTSSATGDVHMRDEAAGGFNSGLGSGPHFFRWA